MSLPIFALEHWAYRAALGFVKRSTRVRKGFMWLKMASGFSLSAPRVYVDLPVTPKPTT